MILGDRADGKVITKHTPIMPLSPPTTDYSSTPQGTPATEQGTSNESATIQYLITRNLTNALTSSSTHEGTTFFANTDLRTNLGVAVVSDNFRRGTVGPLAQRLRDSVTHLTNLSLVDVGPFESPAERLILSIDVRRWDANPRDPLHWDPSL